MENFRIHYARKCETVANSTSVVIISLISDFRIIGVFCVLIDKKRVIKTNISNAFRKFCDKRYFYRFCPHDTGCNSSISCCSFGHHIIHTGWHIQSFRVCLPQIVTRSFYRNSYRTAYIVTVFIQQIKRSLIHFRTTMRNGNIHIAQQIETITDAISINIITSIADIWVAGVFSVYVIEITVVLANVFSRSDNIR